MPSNDSLRVAVKGLRHALGKTQTEFGALIGKSLPTIQRYESLVPPKGKILLKLESLARERRCDEYAQLFRDALRIDLGLDLPDTAPSPVEVPFPVILGCHVAEPKTAERGGSSPMKRTTLILDPLTIATLYAELTPEEALQLSEEIPPGDPENETPEEMMDFLVKTSEWMIAWQRRKRQG